MKKGGFRLKWLFTGAALGAAIYWGPGLVGGASNPAAMAPGGAAPVSIATVPEKDVIEWREFSGILESINAVEIRPRVSGQIMQVHFTDGAEVKKGQPLFTIDPRPYEATMIGAKASLAEAWAALARAKKLIGSKAISRAEFEAVQSAYDRALSAFKTAQVNLDYTRISAPISGKVSRAEITAGNLVDAGGSAPVLASIVALSPIYASFDVDEQTFLATIQGVPTAKLKKIPVEVGLGNNKGTPNKASIHSFDNQIAPGSGTIRVRASLPNTDQSLLPGLYAKVRLGTPEAATSALIHPSAIGTDQDKKFVMVVGEGNKAEYRAVELGTLDGGLQIIRSGLKGGEKIVVNGLQRVRPGGDILGTEVDMTTLAPLNPPADAAEGAVDGAAN
jgi:multidrug efflux system membrane fusion protein